VRGGSDHQRPPRSFHAVVRRQREAWALQHALETLTWDAEAMMPAGAASQRSNSAGVLRALHQTRVGGSGYGNALRKASADLRAAGFEVDSVERLVVARALDDYERERRVPAGLAAELERATQLGRAAWEVARVERDQEQFLPQLDEIVRLERLLAERLGYDDHPYDALLDLYEPGLTTRRVQALLGEVRSVVAARVASFPADAGPDARGPRVAAARQLELARALATTLGFDSARGRVDAASHPNTMHLAAADVRIGVRTDARTPYACIRSTAHECGHALYFQGLPAELEGTPLWGPASAGMNEAQARVWEVLIVASRPFLDRFFPIIARCLPKQVAWSPSEVYDELNRPRRSARRLDADELTYMLHVVLRVELEIDLLEGRCTAAEVPARWNERLGELIGIEPRGAEEGPLQDVHWSIGLFGYFPAYALGTLMACQLWDAARSDLAETTAALETEPSAIRGWLAEKIYAHGRSRGGLELVESATGRPLDTTAFTAHVEARWDGRDRPVARRSGR
jgi:carboxypeptidase Taq